MGSEAQVRVVLALVLPLIFLPVYAQGQDRTLIVEFHNSWAELFLTFPASDLDGPGVASLQVDDGIDMVALRDRPDDVAAELLGSLHLGADATSFEAMSMMAHPLSEPYPYATPFDAMVAGSVCGVPDRVQTLPVAESRLYLNLFRDFPDPDSAALSIDLSFLRGPVEMHVFGDVSEPSITVIDPSSGPVTAARPIHKASSVFANPTLFLALLLLVGAGVVGKNWISRYHG